MFVSYDLSDACPMDTERFADLTITHALLTHSQDGRAKLMFIGME